mmetsp:Transcript_56232/g.100151  ORF Transcript_56232/g.100151 Transcript_56232/m.100151 type:complete len:278 (+) Transcript_56232:1572-2405(+)
MDTSLLACFTGDSTVSNGSGLSSCSTRVPCLDSSLAFLYAAARLADSSASLAFLASRDFRAAFWCAALVASGDAGGVRASANGDETLNAACFAALAASSAAECATKLCAATSAACSADFAASRSNCLWASSLKVLYSASLTDGSFDLCWAAASTAAVAVLASPSASAASSNTACTSSSSNSNSTDLMVSALALWEAAASLEASAASRALAVSTASRIASRFAALAAFSASSASSLLSFFDIGSASLDSATITLEESPFPFWAAAPYLFSVSSCKACW